MPPRFSQERDRRAARQSEARETERIFGEALRAKHPEAIDAKIKAPPERERIAKRFGGGTRAKSGEYDWFYELDPAEQSRIRTNWMSHEAGAVTPDEVEHGGLAMGEWLALTRGIDAARAVQRGRHLQAKRYGGRNPVAFLVKGNPEEHGTRVDHFTDRAGRRREVDRSSSVQFFTDKEGIVHPIRASESSSDPYREAAERKQAASSAALEARHREAAAAHGYDPDEAF